MILYFESNYQKMGIFWSDIENGKFRIYDQLIIEKFINDNINKFSPFKHIYFFQSEMGQKWFKTPNGLKWAKSKNGQDWFISDHGLAWLSSKQGKRWIVTECGLDWIESFCGQKWFESKYGDGWLRSEAGIGWFLSFHGHKWFESEQGQKWFESEQGQKWFESECCQKFIESEWGWCWLKTMPGYKWFTSEKGNEWFTSKKGQQWFVSDYGDKWFNNTRSCVNGCGHFNKKMTDDTLSHYYTAIYWFRSEIGQNWFKSEQGQKWFKSEPGQMWFMNFQSGKQWFESEWSKKWRESEQFKNWLESDQGKLWFTSVDGQKWVKNTGIEFLKSGFGKQYICQDGVKFDGTFTKNFIKWLLFFADDEWKYSVNGIDYLEKIDYLKFASYIVDMVSDGSIIVDFRTKNNYYFCKIFEYMFLPEIFDSKSEKFLSTQLGKILASDQNFKKWISTSCGFDFLQTKDGIEWCMLNTAWFASPDGKRYMKFISEKSKNDANFYKTDFAKQLFDNNLEYLLGECTVGIATLE